MQALAFFEYGGPEVLHIIERSMTTPEPADVVVKVVASAVNPTDILMRNGRQASMMADLQPPYICGFEFSGYVHSAGNQAQQFTVGQPVMGIVNARRPEGGANAQYISVPSASLALLHPGVDMVMASTVPLNGMTARLAIDTLGLRAGHSLLVTGGAGVVGGFVISLAKQAGLIVVVDAKDADVNALCKLGADHIVPRGDEMDEAVHRLYPKGVDGLIDTALLGNRAAALVHEGGIALTLRKSNPITDPRVQARYINVLFTELTNTLALAELSKWLRDGKINPRIVQEFPMSEAASAHRLVETGGLRGRVVIMM